MCSRTGGFGDGLANFVHMEVPVGHVPEVEVLMQFPPAFKQLFVPVVEQSEY